MKQGIRYNERGDVVTHRIAPQNFEEMSEEEQDQWYVELIEKTIENAVAAGKPEDWLHGLFAIKDFIWYLKK